MTDDRAAAFHALHRGRGFVLPNAWDPGSARILAQLGFPAIATTSAGIAWSQGLRDGGGLARDTMLLHLAAIVAAVDVPVTADLEAGYGATPAAVAQTVELAAHAGAVGGNLEDTARGALFDAEEAAERIRAAREAAPRGSFFLNARTDAYFIGGAADPFAETVSRAHRYLDAGADGVFVPGVNDEETIRRLTAEIPAPVNIVAGLASNLIPAPVLLSLGVKRVSLGGSLARVALTALERAGRELLEAGTLSFLDGALPYAEVQTRFAG
ncbi:MAG: isocitrate lyase/phosphoenolpyruvate mutase family protein [Actinobacteria bacterium]|nr:isocitrate lyase/phosphoenolpyruvate mutase family protein [Actinomycetota bacterium]